mmetsp:Transcript_12499/g.24326  ORF Transcript_12499/g.24326 Transcript_12499/m.24326 type:complete len:278 (+) Transcript_12499:333-1166(+)
MVRQHGECTFAVSLKNYRQIKTSNIGDVIGGCAMGHYASTRGLNEMCQACPICHRKKIARLPRFLRASFRTQARIALLPEIAPCLVEQPDKSWSGRGLRCGKMNHSFIIAGHVTTDSRHAVTHVGNHVAVRAMLHHFRQPCHDQIVGGQILQSFGVCNSLVFLLESRNAVGGQNGDISNTCILCTRRIFATFLHERWQPASQCHLLVFPIVQSRKGNCLWCRFPVELGNRPAIDSAVDQVLDLVMRATVGDHVIHLHGICHVVCRQLHEDDAEKGST